MAKLYHRTKPKKASPRKNRSLRAAPGFSAGLTGSEPVDDTEFVGIQQALGLFQIPGKTQEITAST